MKLKIIKLMGSSSSKEKEKKEKEKREKEKREKEKREKEIKENEEYLEEKDIPDQVNQLTEDQTNKILSQLPKCICKIINNDGSSGTGFFCEFSLGKNSEKIKALFTNYHVLNIDDIAPGKNIKLTLNKGFVSSIINIDSKRKVYTNSIYDTTIIEIKDTDNLQLASFLEIDEKNVFVEEPIFQEIFKKKEAYIIQYPGGVMIPTYSFGIIVGFAAMGNFNIYHKCSTSNGSSGSPILNLSNYKVIGIHKGCSKQQNYNLGTFIKSPIIEFQEFNKEGILDNYSALKNRVIKKKKEIKEKNNEIIIKLNVEKKDIKQKIFFMGNFENIFSGFTKKDEDIYLNELNNKNIEIYIDDKKMEKFQLFFEPEYNKEYQVTLKFNIQMKNCSYMFFNCPNIISLDLSSFITTNITNMNHMFGRCYNVKEIDLVNFNTEKVMDMGYLFSKCKNLLNIDLSFFETKKVTNMSCLFNECFNITNIYLPFFNTENVRDMSAMFLNCNKIEKLNLSSFNTKNVKDMSHMFDNCNSLKEIKINPEIFNTENVKKLCHMFKNCNELEKIDMPLNTKSANLLSFMFYECNKLENIDLSKFNTENVVYMSDMFRGCKNLKKIDLSTFSFENLKENTFDDNIFDQCDNLEQIKINKKWKEVFEPLDQKIKNLIINY